MAHNGELKVIRKRETPEEVGKQEARQQIELGRQLGG